MSRFKIGQKVVALKTHSQGEYIKGQVYQVDGFTCCSLCGVACIYLIGHDKLIESICQCGGAEIMRVNYIESSFAPIQNNADAIEYKMSVSIPELITIKEYQNQ